MGLPRRRHHPLRCPIPVLSAASAVILLLALAFLSSLIPPLLDHPEARPGSRDPPPRLTPKISRDSVRRDAATEETFRVPRGGGSFKNDLWASKLSKYFFGCSNASTKFAAAEAVTYRDRYLMIATSGGLNQQRTGITDAVVAARVLNATLVVPKLDQRSFWKDASNFGEIFDADWFISFLSKDVKITKELPKMGKASKAPYTMCVPRKCTPRCYQNRVLPALLKKHVVQLTKFDYRLANKLETDFQKLRCRVNYHALRFTHPIQEMGDELIRRMKEKGKHFIALHLRFEPDMLAFSGCYYGGGDEERRELGAIRKRWRTLHINNPGKARRQGRCPLTPEEVGLLLRALGFGNDVHVYVASGEIYRHEESLAPLKALFPNFHSKETLASKEELEPFSSFSSRMAALDFIVCDGSDAFVTNNNGNMARILAGRRRYFGHKRTIRPNAKKLYSLFLNRANMTWEEFASKVRTYQRGFMGEPEEVRPGRGEFHENPSTCICETAKATEVANSGSLIQTSADNQHGKRNHADEEPEWSYEATEGTNSSSLSQTSADNQHGKRNHADDEPEWSDLDYGEYTPLGKNSFNDTLMDYDLFVRPDDSE